MYAQVGILGGNFPKTVALQRQKLVQFQYCIYALQMQYNVRFFPGLCVDHQ